MEPVTIALVGTAAVYALWAYSKNDDDDDDDDDQGDARDLVLEAIEVVVDPVDPGPSYEPYNPGINNVHGGENEGFPTGPKPPNQGKNGEDYSHSFYPEGFVSVRKALSFLGYDMAYSDTMPPAQLVKNFQYDYNLASEAGFMQATGFLLIDGVPGVNTLNAAQIAATGGGDPTPDDIMRGSVWKTEFGLWGD